jgi:predicted hotdog family 3-hydroxylacyl-ACP dehydratase
MKLEIQEILTHPVIAAAAGALLGLKALPGTSIANKLANVVAGFLLAAWGGAALVEYLEIANIKIAAGAIFMVGAAGLVVFDASIAALKQTDLVAFFTNWLPKRKGGE